MLLLMDAHSGFPVHYNNSDEKKQKQTVDKPFSLVQSECRMLDYEHLFRHHPGAYSVHTGETRTAHVDICV